MVLLLGPGHALASLGEPETSVVADGVALSAVVRATSSRGDVTVHELRSNSAVIREYVSTAGVVFAVAWYGIAHPDLRPLLGSYAGEYEEARRRAPRNPGRRSRRVAADHVVVETWGHMRNLRGRAFVPVLVPAGVRVDEIE
jgi:hypothetical protein